MTFYETLKKVLSTKHRIIVKNNDGDYQIFSCEKDIDGDFRRSCWRSTEEEARQCVASYFSDTEEEINEDAERDNWQIVKAYDLEHEGEFKEGEKVQVIDENCPYYGKIFTIVEIVAGVYTMKESPNEGVRPRYNAYQISYPFKTEETEELTMEEVCKELGRNIKIKK